MFPEKFRQGRNVRSAAACAMVLAMAAWGCDSGSSSNAQASSSAAAGSGSGGAGSGPGGAGTTGAGATGAGTGGTGTTTASGTGGSAATTGTGGHDPGQLIGDFYITYYWFLLEADYSGPDDTVLRDSSCAPIANVPQQFADEVCVEGSGRLVEGSVINYANNCACGHPCSSGPTVCFSLLDPAMFPWGSGSMDNPLVPLRSWAVDNGVIPHGTILYTPEWDGVSIPMRDGIGGFVHDGCFRADDVGNGINGNHFDFFAGTTSMWNELENMFPSIQSHFQVHRDAPHCTYLMP